MKIQAPHLNIKRIPIAIGAALGGFGFATGGVAGAVAGTALGVGSALALSSQQKAQQEAQQKAEDFATQESEKARSEQQRLEEKFGLSAGELERQDRTFELEKTQQAETERRAGLSGEELLREAGPTTRALLDQVAERLGKTSEELFVEEGGEPARLLLEQISSGSTQDDIFENELKLALQGVQQSLGRRGLTATGTPGDIGLESLGRAGVDFAIKSARERLAQHKDLANTLFNISSGTRQEAGATSERALSEQEVARNNAFDFLGNLHRLDQQSQGRAAQVATSAFGTAQNAVNQFGQVPIEIAGQQAGQAAGTIKGATEGLAGIGTTLLSSQLERTSPESVARTKFLESLTTTPGTGLSLFTGGKKFPDEEDQGRNIPISELLRA